MPVVNDQSIFEESRVVTEEEKGYSAYDTLRLARRDKKLFGIREKLAKEKAAEEEAAAKK